MLISENQRWRMTNKVDGLFISCLTSGSVTAEEAYGYHVVQVMPAGVVAVLSLLMAFRYGHRALTYRE
jgi:hypothetical protein